MRTGEAGWRQVLIVAAAVVLGVLAMQVVSTLVPTVGDVVRKSPLVIVVLVVATVAILFLALRGQRARR